MTGSESDALRVLWIDPIGTDEFGPETVAALNVSRRQETEVAFISLPPGRPLDLESRAAEAKVIPDLVRLTQWASSEFDAVILGCFFDTGLRETQDASCQTAVIGPCQAATMLARQLGNKFSVLVGRSNWLPRIRQNIQTYGHADAIASMRVLDVGVYEFGSDHERAFKRLLEQGRAAIEQDGAEVLVLGCTADLQSHHELQDRLGVPVVDAVVAPFKVAELMAETGRRLGWQPGRPARLERGGGVSTDPPIGTLLWGSRRHCQVNESGPK